MPLILRFIVGTFLLAGGVFASPTGFSSPLSAAGQDKGVTVPLEATVAECPPSITLQVHLTERSYAVFRKGPHEEVWSAQVGTIPAGIGTWTDTDVGVGQEYEYRVYGGTVAGESSSQTRLYGYLRAGIAVDMTDWRGRVAVMVADDVAVNLPNELARYLADLAGDGWTPHVITVPKANGYAGTGKWHVPIRDQIRALAAAYPGEFRHVALLGNVPQPRTGLVYSGPDGHGNKAAFGVDAYYAELDGVWTDTGNNTSTVTAPNDAKRNIADDGKWDETRTPATDWEHVELGFGRMDMQLLTEGPLESLCNYLDKLHRYKHAAPDFRPGRKALLREGFDNVGETAWNSIPALTGLASLEYTNATGALNFGAYDLDQRYTAAFGPYLFCFKGNGAPMKGTGGKAVFWTGLQSNWGYWYESDAMSRALAEDSLTLSYTWSVWGTRYFYHRMGLGDVAGDMMKTSINNRGWNSADGLHRIDSNYWPNGNHTGALFMTHLGDPLLRLFMFPPPSDFSARPGAGGVQLSWSASPESGVAGYHVYRSTAMDAPFVRLTSTPLSGTTFTDASITSGRQIYMVRAVKKETTGSGTFWNASQGIFATADFSDTSLPAISTAALPSGFVLAPYEAPLTVSGGIAPYQWELVAGSLPGGLELTAAGKLLGIPLASATAPLQFRVTDAAGQTATQGLTLTVHAGTRREFPAEADAGTNSNASVQTNNYGASRALILASGTPIASWCDTAFLRFRINPPGGPVVSRAVLRLRPSEFSTSTASNTITIRLVDNDSWVEGDHAGQAADNQPSGELVFANRPAPAAAISPVTAPAAVNPTTPWEVDVTDLVNADLAANPDGVMTLQLTTSGNRFSFATREAVIASLAPRLVIEYADAGPSVEVVSPPNGRAHIAPGHSLHLAAVVAHPGTPPESLTHSWTVVSAPAGATASFSSPSALTTRFEADREGTYRIRFTAGNGSASDSRDVVLQMSRVDLSAVLPPEVLHYPLDEVAGTTAQNRAGGPDGQLQNFSATGAWVAGGRFGGALDFSADSGSLRAHIRALTHADYDFSLSRPWTVSFWVRTTQTTNQDLAGKALASQAQRQLRIRHESGNSRSAVVLGGNNTTNIPYDRFRLNDGTWRLVTLVHDPATPSSILFIDGGFTQYAAVGAGTETTVEDFLIGAVRNASGTDTAGDFDGQIDDVRVFDRALTWEEVRDLALGKVMPRAPVIALHGPASAVTPGTAVAVSAHVVSENPAPDILWELASGPGNVTFSSPHSPTTTAVFSDPGTYQLRLTADDGSARTSVIFSLLVEVPGSPASNAPPVVNAGPDQSAPLPGSFQLAGTVIDDGRPAPLTTQWSQLSGPGTVVFADASSPATTVSVRGDGEYLLQLTASDGLSTTSALVRIHVGEPANAAPSANAGADFTVVVNSPATLQGSASDDGLPSPPGTLTFQWSRIDGPGNATFSNPALLTPQVTFDAVGTHILRLSVSDGELTTTDFVVVTVELNSAGNEPPVLNITAPEVRGQFPDTLFLQAKIMDDGLPNPPGTLTTSWTKISGPGDFVVHAASPPGTYAIHVTAPGEYVLGLSATDGSVESSDSVTVISEETARHRLVWVWGRSSSGEAGPFSPLTKPVIVGRGWTKPLPGDFNGLALEARSGHVLATGRITNALLGDPLAVARSYFAPVPGLSEVADLASATEAAVALHPGGTLSIWGKSNNGALGGGNASGTISSPAPLAGLDSVAQVFGHFRTFYALKTDGSLWAWGYNANGKIGTGSTTNLLVPTALTNHANTITVAAGAVHSIFLKADGTLTASGFNFHGSVGDGTTGTDRLTPVPVLTAPGVPLTGIRKVVAGYYHSLALDAAGRVWAWGYNNAGQLGQGNTNNQPLATLVKDAGGVDPLTGIIDIAAGSNTSFALHADGSVLGWGAGTNNLFGEGQPTSNRTLPGPVGGLPANVSAIWANTSTAYATTPWATYEGFALEHFSSAEASEGKADPLHDFDGDGSSNVLEYASGGDPRQPDHPGTPTLIIENGQLVYEIDTLAVADDLALNLESSSSLTAWNPTVPISSTAVDRGDFNRQQLRFNLPANPNRLFLRLRAELDEP